MWLGPDPGRGAALCWRARWRAPGSVFVLLAWWVSRAGDPPCPREGSRGEGVPAMRLSEARLEAPNVGALVRGPIRAVVVSLGSVRWASRKDAQPSGGPQLCGVWGVCRIEECAEWVRCFFLSADGHVEPAASDSEVVYYVLWCRFCPRFRHRKSCLGGREL